MACGHNNEAALLERRVKVVGQADERIGWATRLKALTGESAGSFAGSEALCLEGLGHAEGGMLGNGASGSEAGFSRG